MGGISGLPSWLLDLTPGPIISIGLAQVPESLVGVYLGLGVDALLVPSVLCQRPLGVFQEQ